MTSTILAFVFDLDGTLVETEELKALSYARAAVELRPDLVEADVVEAFKDFVGRSRQEVATGLVRRFGLEEAARSRMSEFGVKSPWQAYVRIRLRTYDALLSDREMILAHRYPHNIALLHELRDAGYRTALATMSHSEQAQRVLSVLGLTHAFEVVATRDDVEHGKPDPEGQCQVELVAAIPGKKPVPQMHREHGDHHHRDQGQRRERRQEPNRDQDSPDELGKPCENCHQVRRLYTELLVEPRRTLERRPTEGTKQLLSAVGDKDHAQ